jgi:hypothetical protein
MGNARTSAVAVAALLLASLGVAWSADGKAPAADKKTPPYVLRYDDDANRLTVHADGVPLDDLMHDLQAQTGLRLRGDLLDGRLVYKRFDQLPLDQALDRLLGRQNFLLIYGRSGRPETLSLEGLSQPRTPTKPTTAYATRGRVAPARPTAAGIDVRPAATMPRPSAAMAAWNRSHPPMPVRR